MKPAVEAEGKLLMWRIAMKPGRPLAFGSVKKIVLHRTAGQPGLELRDIPDLRAAVPPEDPGSRRSGSKSIVARADFDWPEPDARREFLRVKWNAQGGLDLYPTQDSAVSHRPPGRRPGRQSRRACDSQRRSGALPALFGAVLVKVKVLFSPTCASGSARGRRSSRSRIRRAPWRACGCISCGAAARGTGARRHEGGTRRGQPGHGRGQRAAQPGRRGRLLSARDRRLT